MPSLPKHTQEDTLKQDKTKECLSTFAELSEAKEPPFNMVASESIVSIDLQHVLPETWTELEEIKHDEEGHNLPDTFIDG